MVDVTGTPASAPARTGDGKRETGPPADGSHDGDATDGEDREAGAHAGEEQATGTTPTGGEDAGTFEAGPSGLGRGLTVIAGLLASVSLAPVLPAIGVGMVATATLAYALREGSERLLGAGVATLVVALLLGGVLGTPAELLVIAAGATVLAWDVGDNALGVGEQLGRNARTDRLELVHAAASLAVAVVGSAVAYGVFRLAGGGRPVLAVVLLLLGATILVAVLR